MVFQYFHFHSNLQTETDEEKVQKKGDKTEPLSR